VQELKDKQKGGKKVYHLKRRSFKAALRKERLSKENTKYSWTSTENVRARQGHK